MTQTTTTNKEHDYPQNPSTKQEIHELLEKAPSGTKLKLKDARLDNKEIRLNNKDMTRSKRESDGKVWRKTYKHETVTGADEGGLTYVVVGANYTYSSVEVVN